MVMTFCTDGLRQIAVDTTVHLLSSLVDVQICTHCTRNRVNGLAQYFTHGSFLYTPSLRGLLTIAH